MGVTLTKIKSESCHKIIEVGIIVPAEVSCVFIMLHGHGGSISEVERLFPLDDYANKYKMLIAVPELGNSFYLDRVNIDGENDCLISEFLSKELPYYLRNEYGLDKDIKVILGGYSMGGFGTMLHGLNNPGSFHGLISISGAFIANEIAYGSDFVVGSEKKRKEAFTTFMIKDGEFPIDVLPDDTSRNPEAAVRLITDEDKKMLPNIVLTCADRDIWCKSTQRMCMELKEMDIPFYYLEIVDGGHDFKEFDKGFRFAFDHIISDS